MTRHDLYLATHNLGNRMEYLRERVYADDYMGALRQMSALTREVSDLAAALSQAAYDSGQSKAAIARSLDVPPSTFRGMVRA